MSFGGAVLDAAREVQIPIIAALLIGAFAAKAQRAARSRSIDAAVSPMALFPLRLRKPITLGLCAGELVLGIGLILTAGRTTAGVPATAVRALTAFLFAIALATLNEMRSSRPEAGCGCFGELSDTPVSVRTLTRSAILCAGALASIGVSPLSWPTSASHAGLLLGTGAAELLLIAALSPEIGEVMVRFGYREPCEAAAVPVSRTLRALRASKSFRLSAPQFTATEPSDVWREGCWRFVTYPAMIDGRRADVVFAVYLQGRRPPVRAAVVDAPPVVFAAPVLTAPVPSPRSDAELLAQSNGETAPVEPPHWVRPKAPSFTPSIVPVRSHVPAQARYAAPVHVPAQVSRARPREHFGPAPVNPLARAVPRESAHVLATAPEKTIAVHPRFVPHRQPARHGIHERHRS